ncbi:MULTISPECIES: WhiB family transcriptional regulator [Streptomyces]|uniref:WhiB family transcriptional regulator n=1 Tax=Streptomyces TaxID=1883 RepID=UPI00142E08EF|nr:MULTISPECIES: WhiB family transcriptional regulator [Streptomyces]
MTTTSLAEATTSGQWAALAACTGHDTNLWFPEDHDQPTDDARAEALSICATCPVRAACLDAALDEEGGIKPASRNGIRGGMTREQRHNAYRSRARAARKAAAQAA